MIFLFISVNASKRIKGVKNLVFISGQRGTLKLIFRGYSFQRNKVNRDTIYYRCSQTKKYKCQAKLVVNRTNDEIMFKTIDHNHPSDCGQLGDGF